MADSSDEHMQVVVRIRPRLPTEEADPSEEVVEAGRDGELTIQTSKHNVSCRFDHVFGPSAQQQDVYPAVRDCAMSVLEGINATIFAYGPTGTGKTHTMLGDGSFEEGLVTAPRPTTVNGDERRLLHAASWGIIPRVVSDLFGAGRAGQGADGKGRTVAVSVSYMQIYNDNVFDLLQNRRFQKPLQIKETLRKFGRGTKVEVYVSGLSQFRVSTLDEMFELLSVGSYHRAVRATEYNEESSRSHAVLQLTVEVEETAGGEGGGAGAGAAGDDGSGDGKAGGAAGSATTTLRTAKLNLVDLAGSEKWPTGANGVPAVGSKHTRELQCINRSLSHLGNCISALTEAGRRHIPYRDSKLTRLLQDSLGGDTRSVVVATVSPLERTADETVSTLSFADRAKRVMVHARVNEVVDTAVLLDKARAEIAQLKEEIRALKAGAVGSMAGAGLEHDPADHVPAAAGTVAGVGSGNGGGDESSPSLSMPAIANGGSSAAASSSSSSSSSSSNASINPEDVDHMMRMLSSTRQANQQLRKQNRKLRAAVERSSNPADGAGGSAAGGSSSSSAGQQGGGGAASASSQAYGAALGVKLPRRSGRTKGKRRRRRPKQQQQHHHHHHPGQPHLLPPAAGGGRGGGLGVDMGLMLQVQRQQQQQQQQQQNQLQQHDLELSTDDDEFDDDDFEDEDDEDGDGEEARLGLPPVARTSNNNNNNNNNEEDYAPAKGSKGDAVVALPPAINSDGAKQQQQQQMTPGGGRWQHMSGLTSATGDRMNASSTNGGTVAAAAPAAGAAGDTQQQQQQQQQEPPLAAKKPPRDLKAEVAAVERLHRGGRGARNRGGPASEATGSSSSSSSSSSGVGGGGVGARRRPKPAAGTHGNRSARKRRVEPPASSVGGNSGSGGGGSSGADNKGPGQQSTVVTSNTQAAYLSNVLARIGESSGSNAGAARRPAAGRMHKKSPRHAGNNRLAAVKGGNKQTQLPSVDSGGPPGGRRERQQQPPPNFKVYPVGSRLAIYSSRFASWQECVVQSVDHRKGMHNVKYGETGVQSWHKLEEKQMRVVEIAGQGEAGAEAGKATGGNNSSNNVPESDSPAPATDE